MDLERFKFIVRHPYQTYRQHIVKEIRLFKLIGKCPDNIYYVIRCDLPGCGLFAIFMYVLDHLAYAEDHGWIPILDSGRYECLYKEKKPVQGTTDPWKYYFESISDKGVRDCFKLKNVIYGAIKFPRYKGIYYYKDKEKNVLPSEERIDELYKLVEKYIKFRPELQNKLEENLKKLIGSNKRTLGIHIRGTDMYTAGKQHPIPSEKTKDFTLIDGILTEYHIDQIFLCCDTESTVKLFQDYYGEKVRTTNAMRQKDDNGCGIHMDKKLGEGRENHKYLLGEEVIIDMYLLAHCNILLCGSSNVAFTALIYNHNNYDKVFYYV